jgi:hypothetical protein
MIACGFYPELALALVDMGADKEAKDEVSTSVWIFFDFLCVQCIHRAGD